MNLVEFTLFKPKIMLTLKKEIFCAVRMNYVFSIHIYSFSPVKLYKHKRCITDVR